MFSKRLELLSNEQVKEIREATTPLVVTAEKYGISFYELRAIRSKIFRPEAGGEASNLRRGRGPAVRPKEKKEIKQLYAEGNSVREIAVAYGLSPSTVSRFTRDKRRLPRPLYQAKNTKSLRGTLTDKIEWHMKKSEEHVARAKELEDLLKEHDGHA